MLNTKPKTYNELLITSRINVIPRHYSITNLQLEKAFNFLMENPDGTIILIVTNRTEADLAFEFKIETSGKTETAKLRDWEQARTEGSKNTDGLFLKCPPRAIQTWILK